MSAPLVPVTRYVNGPVEAPASAVIVASDVAVPPDGGVMGDGSVVVTPAGAPPNHEPERATAELNPLSEVTVHVLVPLPPCVTVTGDGAQLMVKSGVIGESLAILFTPDSSIHVFPEPSTTTSCG